MNKNYMIKIIKNLRNAGYNKDADALQKAINGEYQNTYSGIKISQFNEEDPFIETTQKLKKLQERNMSGENPLSSTEKQFIGRHTPIGAYPPKIDRRSNWGKLKLDTSYNPEPFGEDVLLHGMSYRDPGQIERAEDPSDIRSQLINRGWPPAGIRLPEGIITDVLPYHPAGAEEIYDPSLGLDIGFVPNDSGEYFFGSADEFGEKFNKNITQTIRELWEEGADYYGNRVDLSLTTFNKNLKDFLPQYKMLSSNFITQTPGIICGNAPDTFSASLDPKHNNLASVIKKRIENIIGIMKGIKTNLINNSRIAELQAKYFAKFQDDITSASDIANDRPDVWLKKLLLVYGNDMDLVADNPLGFDYANPLVQQTGFVKNIIEPYNQIRREKTERQKKQKETKTWEQLFNREFEPITVSGEEAAKERKIIRDIDMWDELATLTGTPAIQAQASPILFSYEKEIEYLISLLARLQEIIDARDQGDLNVLDIAVMNFFRTLTMHYESHDIVNASGKLSGKYSVGNEAKLEIYLKCLYLAKAYNAWRMSQTGEGIDKYPSEMITTEETPQEFQTDKYQDASKLLKEKYLQRTQPSADIENVNAFDSNLDQIASIKMTMAKFAQAFDDMNLYIMADIIDNYD